MISGYVTCDDKSKMSHNSKRTVLSLFTGVGGMDMGFDGEVIVHRKSIVDPNWILRDDTVNGFVVLKPHNFETVFQNDISVVAKEIFGLNGDNSKYNTTSIYSLIDEGYSFPNADVVIGGFPCQDFSHAGRRRGFHSLKSHDLRDTVVNENNSRGTLYKSFVTVVKTVQPKVFVAENVYGLLTMKSKPIEKIMKDFSEVGYDVQYQVIYCPEYGIPQTRKRVIIMGISKKRQKELLKNWNIILKNQASCSVRHYLQHLTEPSDSIDVSQQAYSKAKRLTKGQGQKEINLDGFAPTIRAEHHGNIEFRRHKHSTLNADEHDLPERRLSVREAALIQTFPPKYVFSRKKNMKAYKYIGNAVPPLLGYLIADKVSELCDTYFSQDNHCAAR